MLNYEALTEEQAMAERFQLLKEGEYDAVITASEDKVSSSGNDMLAMTLTVYDAEGREHSVKDFLVLTKSMMWKVVHCVNSAGIYAIYQSGKLSSDYLIGKRVKIKVSVESGKEIPSDKLNGKPFGSKYPDKNKVDDYLKWDNSSSLPNITQAHVDQLELEKDVPF